MRPLLEKIQIANRGSRLFQNGDGIVVGLSGGPDSTALLLLLSKMRKNYGLRLFAAHVNHGLSGRESRQFEAAAEKLAGRLGVVFYREKIDLRALAKKHGKTLEEMGRIARYDFFRRIAVRCRASRIATAHTLDDQAETVLMRMARGAGLKGMSGIPVVRSEGKLTVIRPLLSVTKKELTDFLKKAGEPFCADSSNKKDIFTRNRVRNSLLPWLQKNLNPQIGQGLAELAEICAENQVFVEKLSRAALDRCLIQKKAGSVTLDAGKLARLELPVLSETLFQALILTAGGRTRFGASHIRAVRAMIGSSGRRLEAHLPGRLLAVKEGRRLRIFDSPRK